MKYLKKSAVIIATLAVVSLIIMQPARADGFSSQQPVELGVRVGAIQPFSSNGRIFGGSTQFIGGLNLTLGKTHGRYPGTSSLYFDYQDGTQHSGYVHSGGLGLQYQTPGQEFIGGALGLHKTAVSSLDGRQTGSAFGAGGRVFAGYNLTPRAAVQLDYHFAPSALGVSPNGMGVVFAYRL